VLNKISQFSQYPPDQRMKSPCSTGHKGEWRDPGMDTNHANPLLLGERALSNDAATRHLQIGLGTDLPDRTLPE